LESIVVKSVDFGDTDRLVTLLTKEEGKVVVKLKGVRKAASKLRYSTQPFLHATFILSPIKTGYVVVGCDVLDRFSDLTSSLGAYYSSAFVCEVAVSLSAENYQDEELFDFILNTLRSLATKEISDYTLFALRFLVNALTVAGHGLNTFFGEDDIYFSYENGGFIHNKEPYCLKLSPSLAKNLKLLLKNQNPSSDSYQELFELLIGYYSTNVQKKLFSQEELLKMKDLF